MCGMCPLANLRGGAHSTRRKTVPGGAVFVGGAFAHDTGRRNALVSPNHNRAMSVKQEIYQGPKED